jgi:hypothetical protein
VGLLKLSFIAAIFYPIACGAGEVATALIDGHASLEIAVKGKLPGAQLVGSSNSQLRMTPELRRALAASSEFFVVGRRVFSSDGKVFLLLLTQTLSKGTHGQGYCGAGTEDVLRLVELRSLERRLIQKDEVLIQSCLHNLALADDSGKSLRARLEDVANPQEITLRWLQHPQFGDSARTAEVSGNAVIFR